MKTLTLKCDILFKNITSILNVYNVAHILIIIDFFFRTTKMHALALVVECVFCLLGLFETILFFIVSVILIRKYVWQGNGTYNNNNKHRQMLNFS